MVPNVTCYGRFHDLLKEHLQGKHDWIHKVNIGNTGKVRNPGKTGELPFDIGTLAELTFTIDSSRSTLDLLKAIKDTKQYSLTEWKVLVGGIISSIDGKFFYVNESREGIEFNPFTPRTSSNSM